MAALGEDLLATVNKLQDLVFNTIGNDSLDLPQIVRASRCVIEMQIVCC
jgi:dynamin 1-like protein